MDEIALQRIEFLLTDRLALARYDRRDAATMARADADLKAFVVLRDENARLRQALADNLARGIGLDSACL